MSMELDHSFTVPVPPEQAWDVLLDVARIAPCMPGATVETVEGDDVAGRLKVKVGPVSLTYKGTARFTDRDAASHSVLVEASGKETRGAGTASATVRAALRPQNGADSNGGETLVTLHTTLNVTGRPAQFGRGVIAEVGSRLIDKFADNLAQQLTDGGAPEAPAPGEAASATGPADAAASPGAAGPASAATGQPSAAADTGSVRPPQPAAAQPVPAQHREESLNLLSIAGPVVLKRVAPVVGAAAAVALLTWSARRIFRRRKSA
jgi:carbon monoxide dehydrogenase subunit G